MSHCGAWRRQSLRDNRSVRSPFLINIAALRNTPCASREELVTGELEELGTSVAQVTSPVRFTGSIESIEGGRMVVEGDIHARWTGDCRRCLNPAGADIDVPAREIYEPQATEGETYALTSDDLDLEPLVREAIMLELPVAPVCRPDCQGLCAICGGNRNDVACNCVDDVTDPRWTALEALKRVGD